tara:strand:- start:53 stop:229 length:177 start_codon:yes stop_codon:yes gene_type:complete
MIPLNLICFKCKNFTNKGCIAFLNGIPEIIISGENDHSKPLPNQKNDIVFEPLESNQN